MKLGEGRFDSTAGSGSTGSQPHPVLEVNDQLDHAAIYALIQALNQLEETGPDQTLTVAFKSTAPEGLSHGRYVSYLALRGWLQRYEPAQNVRAQLVQQTDMATLLTYLCFDRRSATSGASVHFRLGVSPAFIRLAARSIIESDSDDIKYRFDMAYPTNTIQGFIQSRTTLNSEMFIDLCEQNALLTGEDLWRLGICNEGPHLPTPPSDAPS